MLGSSTTILEEISARIFPFKLTSILVLTWYENLDSKNQSYAIFNNFYVLNSRVYLLNYLFLNCFCSVLAQQTQPNRSYRSRVCVCEFCRRRGRRRSDHYRHWSSVLPPTCFKQRHIDVHQLERTRHYRRSNLQHRSVHNARRCHSKLRRNWPFVQRKFIIILYFITIDCIIVNHQIISAREQSEMCFFFLWYVQVAGFSGIISRSLNPGAGSLSINAFTPASRLSLYGPNTALGRALVVRETTSNSRVACGVINKVF